MAIDALQDTKDFHPANDMPGALPGMGEHAVFLALIRGQGRRTRRLMGGDGMPVAPPESLVPGIPDQGCIVGQSHARLTEQFQVMNCPSARGGAQHGAESPCRSAAEISGYGVFSCRYTSGAVFFGPFTRHFRSIDAGDAVDELRFLKDTPFRHLKMLTLDQS